MSTLLEAALVYAAKGIYVFPCMPCSKAPATKNGFKDATTDEEQIREWWAENPDYNIGIPTGKVNGFFVLDVDSQEAHTEALERGFIPTKTERHDSIEGEKVFTNINAPVVKTGRGYQVYFLHPEEVEKIKGSAGELGKDLDIRGDGNYVLAPGSVHSNGTKYQHVNSKQFPDPTQPPKKLLKAIQEDSSKRRTEPISEPIPLGERNNTLTSLAGYLAYRGLPENVIRTTLHVLNEEHTEQPLEDEEVDRITIYDNTPDEEKEVGILLSDVQPEEVEWLWPGRIPLGKLTILEGDPDFGKSVMTLDFAARVTTGTPFPSDQLVDVENLENVEVLEKLDNAGGVVIISAEDGLADTIRPRLDAAGADVSKVLALTTVPDGEGNEQEISIPKDIPYIVKAIERVDANLIIIDPLTAFMKGDINKDQDVRKALTPFSRMAEKTGAAVVVLRHFTKNVEAKAIYRGGGSIGIIGAARSALAVAPHPDDEDLKVLVPQKSNLSKRAPAIAYTIVEGNNGAPRTKWGDTVDLSNEDFLNPDTSEETRSEVGRAKTWIADKLNDGPVPSKAIEAMAEEDEISKSTLDRAKALLPVKSKKVGKTWCWVLVEDSQDGQSSQESQGSQDGQESQDGQGSHDESTSLFDVSRVRDDEGGKVVDLFPEDEWCNHGLKDCYLHNPNHPYRLKQG